MATTAEKKMSPPFEEMPGFAYEIVNSVAVAQKIVVGSGMWEQMASAAVLVVVQIVAVVAEKEEIAAVGIVEVAVGIAASVVAGETRAAVLVVLQMAYFADLELHFASARVG